MSTPTTAAAALPILLTAGYQKSEANRSTSAVAESTEQFSRFSQKAKSSSDLLQNVFTWSYKRSCRRYFAITKTMAEPDPVVLLLRIFTMKVNLRDFQKS